MLSAPQSHVSENDKNVPGHVASSFATVLVLSGHTAPYSKSFQIEQGPVGSKSQANLHILSWPHSQVYFSLIFEVCMYVAPTGGFNHRSLWQLVISLSIFRLIVGSDGHW